MCAASTTSLPETPGGERNWDYRYSWIRDSTFMLWGLYSLGFDQEASDFFYFIEDVAAGDELQVCTASAASARIEESELDHLEGYEHSTPGARRQRRLQPEPARRLGHAARLGLHPHEEPRPAARVGVADPRAAGRGGDRALARARPRHLGGPRRAQALHVVEDLLLGGVRPRRAAGAAARATRRPPTRWQEVADEIRADVLRARRRPREAALRPALRQRRARRRAAADPARALPARRRRARPQHGVRRSPTSSARTG